MNIRELFTEMLRAQQKVSVLDALVASLNDGLPSDTGKAEMPFVYEVGGVEKEVDATVVEEILAEITAMKSKAENRLEEIENLTVPSRGNKDVRAKRNAGSETSTAGK